MFCFDPPGNFSNVCSPGDALDNGLGNNDDLVQPFFDQQEGGTSQFGATPHHAKANSRSMNVQPPQWPQQPGGTSQFGTTPHHAEVNSRSMNVQPPQWPQQPGGTSQFGTTPHHAEVNSRSMNVQPPQWPQQPGGTSQFGTTPHHAEVNSRSMNVQPPHWPQQPDMLGEGTSQFRTTPHNPKVNSRSMNDRLPQWAQQPDLECGTSKHFHMLGTAGAINNVNPSMSTRMNSFPLAEPGTSVSSNITNADAAKRAKKKECDRKFREKKEKERRENAEKVAELTKQMNDLREVIASLEKGGVKEKIKQKNDEQQLSYFKEEVSRLNNKLKGQTMQVDVLSEKLVASPGASDIAEENKQLKRKIEVLTTAMNNPDIIKTIKLQEENEKLTHENKKLRIVNDALCDKLSKD